MFQRTNSRGDVIEVTILRIVVRGNKGDEYKKVKSKWGEVFFKTVVLQLNIFGIPKLTNWFLRIN